MFSPAAILDASDATLASGLAYAKEVQRLILTAWALMRPDPVNGAVEPEILERFAQSFDTRDMHPLGNGALDLWLREMPGYIRAGSWERINDHAIVSAYDDALMAIGMIQIEQLRRQRAGVEVRAKEIRF